MASRGRVIRGYKDLEVWQKAAEGRGRFGLGSFLYHLSVATGSLMEVETQFLIAERLGYVDTAQAKAVLGELGEVRRLLGGMVRALRTKDKEPTTR